MTLHNTRYTLLTFPFGAFVVIAFAFGFAQNALAAHAQEDPYTTSHTSTSYTYCNWSATHVLCTDGNNAVCRGSSGACGIDGKYANGPCYTNNCGGGPVCGNHSLNNWVIEHKNTYTLCHYIDQVTAWSSCSNGVQVATAVNWTTTSGGSCQHVPLTRPCPECGPADGVPTPVQPTTGLCKHGTPSNMWRNMPGRGGGSGSWHWQCTTSGGASPVDCSAPEGCPSGQVVVGDACCPPADVTVTNGVRACGCPAGEIIDRSTNPPSCCPDPDGDGVCGCPAGNTVIAGACCPNSQVVEVGGVLQCGGCPAGTVIDPSTNPQTCCTDPDSDGACGCAEGTLDCGTSICIDPANVSDTTPLLEGGGAAPATVTIPDDVCCTVDGTEHCGPTTTTAIVDAHPDNIEISCRCDNGCTGDDCTTTVTEPVQCVCTAFRCSSANTCVASPVIASSLSSPACTRECTTNADCSGGGIQEVTP